MTKEEMILIGFNLFIWGAAAGYLIGYWSGAKMIMRKTREIMK